MEKREAREKYVEMVEGGRRRRKDKGKEESETEGFSRNAQGSEVEERGK